MTQNMDAGTDFSYLFAVPTYIPDLLTAATQTYGEVLQSDIPKRAMRLAKIIARQQPDLISLQEVTLWETISDDNQKTVLYDQLDLLLKALTALNLHYKVVVSQNLVQNQLPVDPSIIGRNADPVQAVSFTDRDVILARSDRKRSELDLSNIQRHVYKNLLTLTLGTTYRGWLSVDAKIRGKRVRFVNTHLETVIPAPKTLKDLTTTIQEAQADELIKAMDTTHLPVILAGDFNADAELAGLGPDQTDTPLNILDAGYTDAWHELYPKKRGFTWPLFQEDPPLGPNPPKPFERIDLIYARDIEVLAVERVGSLTRQPASDHAGVVAKLQLDNWYEWQY
jgi:endonuclease/exonuclease/phosphatase family metal-dependent hydrolase